MEAINGAQLLLQVQAHLNVCGDNYGDLVWCDARMRS